MASLEGKTIASTYKQLLKITSEGVGADASAKYIEDGLGTDTALSLSTTRVGIGTTSPTGLLEVANTSGNADIRIRASNSGHSRLYFGDVADVGAGFVDYDHGTDMRFGVEGSTRMTIDSSGNSTFAGTVTTTGAVTANGNDYMLKAVSTSTTDGHASRMSAETGVAQGKIEIDFFNDSSRSAGGYGAIQVGKTSNAPQLAILAAAGLGINETNPSQTLHIKGASNTGGIRLANTGVAYYNEIRNNGDGLLLDIDKGDAGGAGADLRINISDSEKMRITNDGNVGIGHTTPQYGLTMAQGNADGQKIGWEDGSNNKRGAILVNSDNDSMELMTGTSDAVRMTIKSDGKVGIGTTNPDTRLTIAEAIQGNASDTMLNTTGVHIDDTTPFSSLHATKPTGGGINFSGVFNSSNEQIIYAGIRGLKENATDGNYDGALVFGTIQNGGNIAEKARITSSGILRLGGTKLRPEHATLNRRLQLLGSGDGYMDIGPHEDDEWGYIVNRSLDNGLYFGVSNGSYNFDTGHIRPFDDNEISLGEGNARFVNCHLINNPSVTSDERKKDNIKPSSLGLEFVNKLNPVQYKWKDYEKFKKAPPNSKEKFTDKVVKHTYKRTHYGLIAQEVEKVVADSGMTNDDFAPLVHDKENDTYAMMYGEYVGILIKAVQELSAKVEALENA